MTLALTPEMLVAAYAYFLVTPPFRAWRLPTPEEIKFSITGHHDRHADCWDTSMQDGSHTFGIRMSRHFTGHTQSLLVAMAHEMIHVRQYVHKLTTANTKHNAAFKKDNLSVCRYHGFDPKAFG